MPTSEILKGIQGNINDAWVKGKTNARKKFAEIMHGEKSPAITQKRLSSEIGWYLPMLRIDSASPIEEVGKSVAEHRVIIKAKGNERFRLDQYDTPQDHYFIMSDFGDHNKEKRVMSFMKAQKFPLSTEYAPEDAYKIYKGKKIPLTPTEQFEFMMTVRKAEFDPESKDTGNLIREIEREILVKSSA